MSDLQKSLAKLKPIQPPTQNVARQTISEEAEEDSSSASSVSSTGTILPDRQFAAIEPDSSVSWLHYFERELYLTHAIDNGVSAKYHVYLSAPRDPSKDPVFICHHGAGSSGLSFAILTQELRDRCPSCGVLAVEARDHGSAVQSPSTEPDFTLAALTSDLLNMIRLTEESTSQKYSNIVLVGHSMGGAVVARVAADGSLGTSLIGYVVIDVVEGSAMDALKHMSALLADRPQSFSSVQSAIDWHVRSRTIRSPESSRISTPTLIRQSAPATWTWRTDLSSTHPFWDDWFVGLSQNFLSGKAAKLLVLAGTDRLDRELMIGQMQGKFQLTVIPEAGHFVQEDAPDRLADTIVEFYRRNDRSALVLPPKVSDLIAQGKKV